MPHVPYKPLPITGSYFVATVTTGRMGGVSFQNKLYYKLLGDVPENETLKFYADSIHTHWAATWRALLPAEIYLFPTTLRWRTGVEDLEQNSTENAAAGTHSVLDDAGELMPEGNQVVIQRRTGKAGRNKRGRVFIPWVLEKLANDSTLNAEGLLKYKALATKLSNTVTVPDRGEMIPATPDGKTGVLEQVMECRLVSEIMSRRDRRTPKRPVYFSAVREFSPTVP
jgi:hypothetical protein